jgi:hypothetical protein
MVASKKPIRDSRPENRRIRESFESRFNAANSLMFIDPNLDPGSYNYRDFHKMLTPVARRPMLGGASERPVVFWPHGPVAQDEKPKSTSRSQRAVIVISPWSLWLSFFGRWEGLMIKEELILRILNEPRSGDAIMAQSGQEGHGLAAPDLLCRWNGAAHRIPSWPINATGYGAAPNLQRREQADGSWQHLHRCPGGDLSLWPGHLCASSNED